MNRSTSIIILTILQLIGGLLNLFNCLIFLALGAGGAGLGALFGGSSLGGLVLSIFLIFAIIELIQGIFCLILSIGLFYRKSWAWVGTLIVHVMAMIKEVTKLFVSGGVAVNFLNAGFSIASLYYLMRSDVRQDFQI